MRYQWAAGRAEHVKDAYWEMLEVVDPTSHESRAKSFQTAMDELKKLEPFTAPKDLAQFYDRLGRRFFRWNRLDEAEGLHRRALDLRNTNAEAVDAAASLNNLALVLSAKGETEEAAQLFSQAHDLFADAAEIDDDKKAPFYDILHNLAGLERRLGNPREAERLYSGGPHREGRVSWAGEHAGGTDHPQLRLAFASAPSTGRGGGVDRTELGDS